MPAISVFEDQMVYGFPTPPEDGETITEPDHNSLDIVHSNSYLTHQLRSTRLTTKEQIEGAIHQLSAAEIMPPSTAASVSSMSSASSAPYWSTPPTPITPASLVHPPFIPPPVPPEPQPSHDPYMFGPSSHTENSMRPEPQLMTNRKIARVRPGYRAPRRIEVCCAPHTQIDHIADPSSSNAIPDLYSASSNPFSNYDNRSHPAQRHTGRAVQVQTNMSNDPAQRVRAVQETFRNASRRNPRVMDVPYATPRTTADSRYSDITASPFADSSDTSHISARPLPPDLGGNETSFNNTRLRTAPSPRPVESLATHARSPQVPLTEAHFNGVSHTSNATVVPSSRSHEDVTNNAYDISVQIKEVKDTDLPLRCDSAMAQESEAQSSKAQAKKRCALLRWLKKVFKKP
ncbi:hypothetical protein C7974DRAFT_211399 [Boeremia exigua]|uniref:uncharacterized protein n=1 Tax=Boeremia exigua TaxID=749465 RepID=UPI001E8CD771|nr:uncharacterized protein C7974DRAFT_211399 [Boeremia exigua]KAH6621801.1 hypothetical protein C7974DRAFT_211399 [Boeremia exigua]